VRAAQLQQRAARADRDVVAVRAQQQHPVEALGQQAQHR
jgi:hypothetical protein